MIFKTGAMGDMAYDLSQALKICRDNGEKELKVPQGEYHIFSDMAEERVYAVSNNGMNGFKKAALHLDGFNDFIFDGDGSVFILHGEMDFAMLKNCENITFQNFTIRYDRTYHFQGVVSAVGEDWCEITLDPADLNGLYLGGNELLRRMQNCCSLNYTRTLEYNVATGEVRRGLGDDNFGMNINKLKKQLNGNVMRIIEPPVLPLPGNIIVFVVSYRCNCVFFMEKSSHITLSKVTVNGSYAMGLLAQKCGDITLDGFSVVPQEGRYFSAGQDGTHFVNCRGLITIKNCLFANQMDDAINIHGIYTRVIKVYDDNILVKYSHYQSTGIDIYQPGDELVFMTQSNQKPIGWGRVVEVEVINSLYTRLKVEKTAGEINVDNVVENLSDVTSALITNCDFRNNRARGMLIAGKGHIEILKNVFHTAGASIQFESDAFNWYESGGVLDVVISENLFDDCKHGRWGRATIDINPRKEVVPGFYYHKSIEITENIFTQTGGCAIAADNVENLTFHGNKIPKGVVCTANHCILNGEKVERYHNIYII